MAVVTSPVRTSGLRFVLQILCATAFASLPSLFEHVPAWRLPGEVWLQTAMFAASYLGCAAVLIWGQRGAAPRGFGWLVVLLCVAYAPSLLVLALAKLNLPRSMTLAQLILGALLVLLTSALRRTATLQVTMLAAVAAAGIAIQVPFLIKPPPPVESASARVQLVNSSLYPLSVTEYRGWWNKPTVAGGGMTPVGDRYLLATGDGDLYLVAQAQDGRTLSVKHVPYRVPINSEQFSAAVGTKIDASAFRVADVLVQELDGKTRLFATHHYWKPDAQCFVVRVSMLESPNSAFLTEGVPGLTWRTVFETSPCVPIEYPGRPPHFGGIQVGGRMALLNPHELLVTVGDNELDGLNSPLSAPQDPAISYGKTIVLNLEDMTSRNFSIGHRNPQGLFVDPSGTIWATEHGPQGGDELNLLERGANYGWPLATYGVQYGTHSWPLNTGSETRSDFREPYYSWIPSIGVSSLLVSHSPLFKLWNGDLLVSSLKDKSLYRVRTANSRVVMMERIPIGERIRDINEGRDGELLLWTDSGALLVVRVDVDVGAGESVFHVCSGCHVIDNGDENGFGPDLYHIVNRRVAVAPGFNYSPAMKGLGGRWTPERLDAFLRNPQQYVPGTKMRFAGVPDAEQRAKLIRYLSSSNRPAGQPQTH